MLGVTETNKALVRSKKLTALALNFCKTLRSCSRSKRFALTLESLKVGNVQQTKIFRHLTAV